MCQQEQEQEKEMKVYVEDDAARRSSERGK